MILRHSERAERVEESQTVPRKGSAIQDVRRVPGFFRTELLTDESTSYATGSIGDYAARRDPLVAYWKSMNGKRAGDPAKLPAIITIAGRR